MDSWPSFHTGETVYRLNWLIICILAICFTGCENDVVQITTHHDHDPPDDPPDTPPVDTSDIVVTGPKFDDRAIVIAGQTQSLHSGFTVAATKKSVCISSIEMTASRVPAWDRPTSLHAMYYKMGPMPYETDPVPVDEDGEASIPLPPNTVCVGPDTPAAMLSVLGTIPQIVPPGIPGDVAHSGDLTNADLKSLTLDDGRVVVGSLGTPLLFGPDHTIRKSRMNFLQLGVNGMADPDGRTPILKWTILTAPEGGPAGIEYFFAIIPNLASGCVFKQDGAELTGQLVIDTYMDDQSFASIRLTENEVVIGPGLQSTFTFACTSPPTEGKPLFVAADLLTTDRLDCTGSPFAILQGDHGPVAPPVVWTDFSDDPHSAECSPESSLDYIGDAFTAHFL